MSYVICFLLISRNRSRHFSDTSDVTAKKFSFRIGPKNKATPCEPRTTRETPAPAIAPPAYRRGQKSTADATPSFPRQAEAAAPTTCALARPAPITATPHALPPPRAAARGAHGDSHRSIAVLCAQCPPTVFAPCRIDTSHVRRAYYRDNHTLGPCLGLV